MKYRMLGKTGLKVSEIGFGAEWIGELSDEEARDVAKRAHEAGVNIVDCWMADPAVRAKLGYAIEPHRDDWIIQAHFGSTWQDGQYVRTRDMDKVVAAFEDELRLLRTDHFELGMIHYVDAVDEYRQIMAGPFFAYVKEQLDAGVIEHIGISTHNPDVAQLAAEDGRIEMIMFSINPAFDLMPPTDDIEVLFGDYSTDGKESLAGIDPTREKLYATCERNEVGITVMKPLAGGRLLSAEASPFGVALTPTQCIHYCLTRPAVASVMVGFRSIAELEDAVTYETSTPDERDYASVLAKAPAHAYYGQCTYCGHCAPCSAGINIALVNKFADLAAMQAKTPDEVPEGVRGHYAVLDATAADCTGCQDCEQRCPFGVPVAEKMQQTAELFGF